MIQPRWRANFNLSRARARYYTRSVNTALWGIKDMAKPKEWDEMTELEQLKWARAKLQELVLASSEDDRARIQAAGHLVRSLEASVMANRKQETAKPEASVAHDRSYLEAVKAEIEAKLAEMEKVKS